MTGMNRCARRIMERIASENGSPGRICLSHTGVRPRVSTASAIRVTSSRSSWEYEMNTRSEECDPIVLIVGVDPPNAEFSRVRATPLRLEPSNNSPSSLTVEKSYGRSLVLGGRRHVLLDGQVSQEAVDIAFGKFPGMLVLVELDVPTNPVHVRFFRAWAVMAAPQNSDEVVVEPGRRFSLEQLQRLRSLTCRRHGLTPLPAQMDIAHDCSHLARGCSSICVEGTGILVTNDGWPPHLLADEVISSRQRSGSPKLPSPSPEDS